MMFAEKPIDPYVFMSTRVEGFCSFVFFQSCHSIIIIDEHFTIHSSCGSFGLLGVLL